MRRIATLVLSVSLGSSACGGGTGEDSRTEDKRSPAGTTASPDAAAEAKAQPAEAKERQIASLPAYREVTIPKGTKLSFRLQTPVASDTTALEDPVRATLRRSVTVNGVRALPAGTLVTGLVTSVKRSARVKGRASVGLRFTSVVVDSESIPMKTTAVRRVARGTKGRDAKTIGIPAAGGGAGTAVVLSTRWQEVRLPTGTIVTARLAEPLVLRIPARVDDGKVEEVKSRKVEK